MPLSVHRERCIGSGTCVYTAPDVFAQDEQDGLVTLLTDGTDPADERSVRSAVERCPVAAISLDQD
ncbi:ferredoxin [Kitasatospora sp. NPDC101801]|uniref:ferredoxin n=1 Tax=unclassified Kitasatospora TaxID=2633591 RepID=UPI00324E15ED